MELPSHTLMIGEIRNVSALESCMDGEQPDIFKVDPLVYDAASRHYYRLGGEETDEGESVAATTLSSLQLE